MKGWLAVTGESDGIDFSLLPDYLLERPLQCSRNLSGTWQILNLVSEVKCRLRCPAVLAIKTIKGAQFVMAREQVKAEG
jgi:hypothetical protein